MSKTIKLPQYIWFNPKEVEFTVPDSWRITINNIDGYGEPALNSNEIRDAIASPIGMKPLREYARGKNDVVVLFDDLSRSTRVSEIVPHVLAELAAAGIKDDQIRFIAAVANHQALDRISMVKKLGEDVVSRFRIYNHCPFVNCTYVGTTSYGTKASINSEVMNCDLKIGIGQVVPHPQFGFGGGAKIIMPGVASYETVVEHHTKIHQKWKQKQVKITPSFMGIIDGNPANLDAREIGKLAGIDMVIDCIVNMWGETMALYAGALEPTYTSSIERAKSHYVTVNTHDNDIVIANAFIKASEYHVPLSAAQPAVKPDGGDIVVIASSPYGDAVHYLSKFGTKIQGPTRHQHILPNINRVIIYSEYPEVRILDHFVEKDKVILTSNWSFIINLLEKSHKPDAKVAVYPSADIQYFAGKQ